MDKKIITAQIYIDQTPGEFKLGFVPRTLVLKNITTNEVETVDLPEGETSLSYIKDKDLNGDSWIKFASDEVYDEVNVNDKTERNIIINKLKKIATNVNW